MAEDRRRSNACHFYEIPAALSHRESQADLRSLVMFAVADPKKPLPAGFVVIPRQVKLDTGVVVGLGQRQRGRLGEDTDTAIQKHRLLGVVVEASAAEIEIPTRPRPTSRDVSERREVDGEFEPPHPRRASPA